MTKPPRLQSDSSCDFDKMTTMMFELLKEAWGPDWGVFCEAFPNGRDKEDIDFPIITYESEKSFPGPIGPSGRKEIKPRNRETIIDEEDNVKGYVRGQVMEHVIFFDVWEENNAKLYKIASKFKNFLNTYTGFLKKNGVKEMIFLEEIKHPGGLSIRDNAVGRRFIYQVILEDLEFTPSEVFERVTATVAARLNLTDDYKPQDGDINIVIK
ncbi:hypothetical protein KLEB273_gp024 [Bacillus phage vB_BauM_KLEB27-3]|nr:hypothetical protein KLEB273_gp024 [Bacillus phage vB_BauM_KLEB27-3]